MPATAICEICVISGLLLIRWDFGQDRRLQHPFFFFLSRIHRQAAGRDQVHGGEDNQVALDVLIDIGAEKPAEKWNVAYDRSFIFHLLHIFTHQTAQHNRLSVPHAHVRGHLPCAKDRLVDHVLGERDWRRNLYARDSADTNCIDGTPVIDEAFKLDHLRHQIQVDRHTVRADHRFNFQCHARVPSFKRLRGGRRRHNRDNRVLAHNACRCSSGAESGDLRRRKRDRVTKFTNNFDHGALAALGRHFRRGEKIYTFFLAEPPKHDLELWICKNTSETKNSRSRGAGSQRRKQERVECIRANGGAAGAVSGNWKLAGGEGARVVGVYSVWRERKIGVGSYTGSSR